MLCLLPREISLWIAAAIAKTELCFLQGEKHLDAYCYFHAPVCVFEGGGQDQCGQVSPQFYPVEPVK